MNIDRRIGQGNCATSCFRLQNNDYGINEMNTNKNKHGTVVSKDWCMLKMVLSAQLVHDKTWQIAPIDGTSIAARTFKAKRGTNASCQRKLLNDFLYWGPSTVLRNPSCSATSHAPLQCSGPKKLPKTKLNKGALQANTRRSTHVWRFGTSLTGLEVTELARSLRGSGTDSRTD